MMDDNQSKGLSGENYVNQLAYKSYLKYWCYPNPKDITGDYKEFCDLLILFRDIAIIISVKNHHYNGNENKYRRKVVEKSSDQLIGAYRKLFTSNREIFIEHPDRGAELFNPNKYKDVFRITINVGEQFEYYSLGENVEGRGFINILNKETFDTIINELDTIVDLTEYFEKREKLLLSGFLMDKDCREKDLLALYITNERNFPVQHSEKEGELKIINCANQWNSYEGSTAYSYKKEHDHFSYFIDDMVRDYVLKLPKGEMLARELMNTSRFERRMLSDNWHELVSKYKGSKPDTFARRYYVYNGIGHLLIYYGREVPQDQIDELIQSAAKIYSYRKGEKEIIMLAATDNMKQFKFGLFVGDDIISEKAAKKLDELIVSFGWFTNEKAISYHDTEFPDVVT